MLLYFFVIIVPISSSLIGGNSTLVADQVTLVDARPVTFVDVSFCCRGVNISCSFRIVLLVFVPWSKKGVGGCGFFSITMKSLVALAS